MYTFLIFYAAERSYVTLFFTLKVQFRNGVCSVAQPNAMFKWHPGHLLISIKCRKYIIYRLWGCRGPRPQWCDWKATVGGSIPTWGNELLFFNIFISSFWHEGKTRRWVPPLKTQNLEKFGAAKKVGNEMSNHYVTSALW